MGCTFTRRCWAEINLDALEHNMRWILGKLSGETPVAVVKADAYGCGAAVVARLLSNKFHIDHWAVSGIDEAEQLRKDGIQGDILILGYTPPELAEQLAQLHITQALLCEEYVRALSECAQKAGVVVSGHIALDTGMSRIGFVPESDFRKKVQLPGIRVTGAFTHLCHADSTDPDAKQFTERQLGRFADAVQGLPGAHCRNSAAILCGIGTGYAYARPGIIIYGLRPSDEVYAPELRPVLSLKAVVSMVKTIQPGDTVGYGRTFRAEKPTRVATVPCGYADGYSRLLSNKAVALIGGKRVRVIGNVCMDQLTLDVTGLDVAMGDVVTLIGSDGAETYTADDMARQMGSIGYEVTCDIAKRVPRVYLQNGQVVEAQNWI